MIPKAASIFFGAAWTVLAAWALGRLLLRRFPVPLARSEFHILAFVSGAAALSTVIFLLASLHLIYDATFWALGATALAAGWRWGAPVPPRATVSLAPWWFWAAYVPFAVMYVIVAMSPEMSPDGSGYHLSVVGAYYRAHGFVPILWNMYAQLSMGAEMLYLMAYAFGRHSAAALTHCAFLLALPPLMVSWASRCALRTPGAAAALLVFCSPVAGVDGTSAYIDMAAACAVFAVFYLVELWRTERPGALVPLIGLLAGFCFALKYTAFLAVPYAAFVLLRQWQKHKEPVLRPLAAFAAMAALMMVPWLSKNALRVGNPVSPLFNRVFPNPFVHVSFEQDYGEFMRNYPGLKSHWELPLELTVRGEVLSGLLGAVFLLAPIALLAWRVDVGQRLLRAALLFGLPYALNVGTRFLLPALPFLALAMAIALLRWKWALWTVTAAQVISSIPPVLTLYCAPYAWRIARIPLKQALRIESEGSWLNYRWPSYRVARMVENSTPEGAIVYSFSPFSESYTTREIRTGFQSAPGERLRDTLWMALIPDWQPQERRAFAFPVRALRRIRVVQTAGGTRDNWGVHELRIFHGGEELPRAPHWRLRANPFPWDVQLAFDNGPETRWRSWERLRPNMWIEVDFGRPTLADQVHVEQSPDQHGVRVKLEGDSGDGQWTELAAEPVVGRLPIWLGLRRMATEELKRSGATHLLINDGDYKAEDFEKEAALWNIERAGEVDDWRLYRLK